MQDIEEEKKKAKIWMIISVIAILIGITLLVIIVIMLVSRSKPKHCPACIVSQATLAHVDRASEYLGRFSNTLTELGGKSSSCKPMTVSGACPVKAATVSLRRSAPAILRRPTVGRPAVGRPSLKFT